MAETFDPYLKWLGIAPKDQPPNHYRLLGIDLFMDDPDVIENAADQRMAHVRSFQSGKRAGQSQKILNEIATAKVCLLDLQQKEAYDRTLRAQPSFARTIPKAKPLPARSSNVSAADPRPANVASPFDALSNVSPPGQGIARRRQPKPAWQSPLVLGICGVLTLLVIVGVVYVFVSGSGESDVVRAPGEPPKESPAVQPAPLRPANQPDTHPDTALASPDAAKMPSEPVSSPEVEPEDDVATKPPVEIVEEQPIVEPPQNQPAPPATTSAETGVPEANGTEPSMQKRAIPDAAAAKGQQELITDLFKDDIAAATTDDAKLALAKTWIQHAAETKDDDAARYVLLRLAAQTAVNVGDADTALAAVDELASYFEMDAWSFRISALAAIAKARGEDFKERNQHVAELAAGLVDRAVADANFDSAKELVDIALTSARSAKDISLVKELVVRNKEIDAMVKAEDDALAALATLENDSSDPNANLIAGRYRCFVKGEWSKGLPLLAKSNDADLKVAAEMELAAPTDPEAQVKIADIWWRLAEAQNGLGKGSIREHAVFWYRKALPAIDSSLLRKVVEERLAQISEHTESGIGGDAKLSAEIGNGDHEAIASKLKTKPKDADFRQAVATAFDMNLHHSERIQAIRFIAETYPADAEVASLMVKKAIDIGDHYAARGSAIAYLIEYAPPGPSMAKLMLQLIRDETVHYSSRAKATNYLCEHFGDQEQIVAVLKDMTTHETVHRYSREAAFNFLLTKRPDDPDVLRLAKLKLTQPWAHTYERRNAINYLADNHADDRELPEMMQKVVQESTDEQEKKLATKYLEGRGIPVPSEQ